LQKGLDRHLEKLPADLPVGLKSVPDATNDDRTRELWLRLPGSSLSLEESKQDYPMSRTPSVFSGRWMAGKTIFASLAILCLLAAPARSPAQDAGVSGIPPGPGNVNGLNGSIRDPSGIGNAAKIPALPQPTITPVMPPTVAPSAGYRSYSPAYSFRPIHVRRAVKAKRTRYASKRAHHAADKTHVSKQDRRTDYGVTSICRGC
jgi:hypothetical protein